MKIHEYQGKEILRRYGVPTLRGVVVRTPEEAAAATESLGGSVWVVKSQVHAGGRGQGRFTHEVAADVIADAAAGNLRLDQGGLPGKGGVRICTSADAAKAAAAAMLGNTLVTKQTGAAGSKVNTLFVEEGCRIAKEYYLAMLLDRACSKVLIMASAEGGTEIEEVAAHTPEKILKVWIDPVTGLGDWQARDLGFGLGLTGKSVSSFVTVVKGLYAAYMGHDCAMLEINPLILTADGGVLPLDAKITFDENALYRHPDAAAMRDLAEEDPAEIEAGKYNLSFIKLDGSIGCLVNGAGLAMATMDIIKFHGEEPANFLDVGGGADKEKVTAAFQIIMRDPAVKAILVNIFGGIMKCDIIATGIITAAKEIGVKVPVVVRLEGTNVELGKKMLAESGLALVPANDLTDAAKKIVSATR